MVPSGGEPGSEPGARLLALVLALEAGRGGRKEKQGSLVAPLPAGTEEEEYAVLVLVLAVALVRDQVERWQWSPTLPTSQTGWLIARP